MTALLAALALIFSYIEVLIPFSPAIPGIKLGIANLVVIVALYHMGLKYAITINVVRIFIAGLLFSGVFGIIYSLAGAILSMTVMVLLKKTGLFSVAGVSMAGGVAHNLGQILAAAFLVSNLSIFIYFPVLIFSGLISGALIGIVAYIILKRLPGDRPTRQHDDE
ncbi:MAG TPA: Gx transporter family protein [Candidatus Copromorpha excrementipullorum]|uniref:Gx transporter family protein n=1 Tax=Candidatus Allocopromorpha excrementipullorum TaxID=2840743 RepID=A0A9D1N642_9FIRM|nr:Gx transporter family protein [Candidatus Copromorpha excrementipullorum]